MGIAELELPVAVHEEYLQWRLEVAVLLLAMYSLVLEQHIHLLVDNVLALITPTHRTFLTVFTIRHGPREHTRVTEQMIVVALSCIVHDQEADAA